MVGSGIDEVRQTQLADSPQPLKKGMLNELKNYGIWNCNESIYRIVQYFMDIGHTAKFDTKKSFQNQIPQKCAYSG
jgi:hypothetical protein